CHPVCVSTTASRSGIAQVLSSTFKPLKSSTRPPGVPPPSKASLPSRKPSHLPRPRLPVSRLTTRATRARRAPRPPNRLVPTDHLAPEDSPHPLSSNVKTRVV